MQDTYLFKSRNCTALHTDTSRAPVDPHMSTLWRRVSHHSVQRKRTGLHMPVALRGRGTQIAARGSERAGPCCTTAANQSFPSNDLRTAAASRNCSMVQAIPSVCPIEVGGWGTTCAHTNAKIAVWSTPTSSAPTDPSGAAVRFTPPLIGMATAFERFAYATAFVQNATAPGKQKWWVVFPSSKLFDEELEVGVAP